MAQVGGKFWHLAFNINPGPIPPDQRANRKCVPEIVQVWSFCSERSAQINPPSHPQKLFFGGDYFWPAAIIQDKESRGWSFRVESVTFTPIRCEFAHGGRMNRNQTRFSPFGHPGSILRSDAFP
jgi:hypothetical protein